MHMDSKIDCGLSVNCTSINATHCVYRGVGCYLNLITMNNINEILDAIKTDEKDKLSQIVKDNPLIADMKTEQEISLLLFATY